MMEREHKLANLAFALVVVFHLAIVAVLTVVHILNPEFQLNIVVNLLLSEGLLILPGIIVMTIWNRKKESGDSFCQRIGFKKIKIRTILLTVLFTYLMMPLTTLLNLISMLFVDNTVAGLNSQIIGMPFWLMYFLMAIYGPFCEEFVFRGVVHRGYRRRGASFGALMLSSFLFAIMHMNLNQAMYAFAIGIALGLLVEATGSVWPAFVCHLAFNGNSVMLMFLLKKIDPAALADTSTENPELEIMLVAILFLLLIALATTTLAGLVLYLIAKIEKRTDILKCMLPKKSKRGRGLISVSLIVGIVLAVGYIIFDTVMSNIL